MPIRIEHKVEAMRLLIKGGKIAAEEGPLVPGDVLIIDGVITAVGEGLDVPPEAQVIEAEGKIVAPAMFDAHVHFREP
ncbi:MAG TPA: hypothetical protein DIV39_02655, partial [Verrucomicrobiales bacterium]|nr:hypothetical protein [Verrucomicrobiales bacterium]